ncbi:hypothetical protein ABZ153_31745 [Streptomyces sp. NPDC006290]|uniref:hypothetical protein n=1 Tax=Streptomyces sp. NPDC006290 TaxID=3156745 RepID=UPI0033A1590A
MWPAEARERPRAQNRIAEFRWRPPLRCSGLHGLRLQGDGGELRDAQDVVAGVVDDDARGSHEAAFELPADCDALADARADPVEERLEQRLFIKVPAQVGRHDGPSVRGGNGHVSPRHLFATR